MARQLADDDFKAWFARILLYIRKVSLQIMATGAEQSPKLLAFVECNGVEEVHMLALQFRTQADKELAALLQKALASEPSCRGAVFVTEAWTIAQDPGKPIEGSLEHVPGRKEILMVIAMRGDMQLMATMPIERPQNTLGEARVIDVGDPKETVMGRFVNEPTQH